MIKAKKVTIIGFIAAGLATLTGFFISKKENLKLKKVKSPADAHAKVW